MNNRMYSMELAQLVASVPEDQRGGFLTAFAEKQKNPVLGLGFAVWLGSIGADRFYRGQIFLGLLKLLTGGGLGVWTVIDWFMVGGAIRASNLALARSMRASVT